jgi:hypothetical protein
VSLLPWLEEGGKERMKEAGKKGGKKSGRGRTKADRGTELFPYPYPSTTDPPAPKGNGEARQEAAQLAHVNPRYVSDAKRIREEAPQAKGPAPWLVVQKWPGKTGLPSRHL